MADVRDLADWLMASDLAALIGLVAAAWVARKALVRTGPRTIN